MNKKQSKRSQKTTAIQQEKPAQAVTQQSEHEPLAQTDTSTNKLAALLKDRPIYANSLAAALLGLDRGSVMREMQAARAEMIRFYMGPGGGNLALEEALKAVDYSPDDLDTALGKMLSQPVDNACWDGLQKLYQQDPELAKIVWQLIKDEARKEFESGHQAARVFEPVHWLREPWRRAQYLGIRESFIKQWQPQGGIELALIDQLTQSFYLYLYWNEVSVKRTQTEMRTDPPQWIEERARRDRSFPRQREHGYWDPPYAHEVEAVEHAAQMADQYQRAFQRTLRSLRDLRRYSTPVTIYNPQQVNIAANGGQQVNAVKVES